LAAGGELADVRDAHAAYYLSLAETAARELRGAGQKACLDHLTREQENLRAALTWLTQSGTALSGLRLAAALGRFWELAGRAGEGRAALRRLLALPTAVGSGAAEEYEGARAAALCVDGALAYEQDDYAASAGA